jgi:hypothetical protein
MKPLLTSLTGWALLFTALAPFRAFAATDLQITLVGDMYDAGKKVSRPTPEQPAYYYPIVDGYAETGSSEAGRKPPPTLEVVHHLAKALASQGYLVTREMEAPGQANARASGTTLSPRPSLVLVFNWGYLTPMILNQDFTNNSQSLNGDVNMVNPQTFTAAPTILNRDKMLGLVAGKNYDSVADFGPRMDQIEQSIRDPRFFVMVSAYDFGDYFQRHKKTLLWVAKISTPATVATVSDTLLLIDSGAALFGRETLGPKTVVGTEGRVEVGTPVTKDFLSPPTPQDTKRSP